MAAGRGSYAAAKWPQVEDVTSSGTRLCYNPHAVLN